MAWGLTNAVGKTNEGGQCPNVAADQQQVAELLDAVANLPIEIPGVPHEGTLLADLPPIEDGHASEELSEAIRRFQTGEGDLTADARVDVGGATWQRLIGLVNPEQLVPGPSPVLLTMRELVVTELPATASGVPSFGYTLRGQPVASFAAPGILIELSVVGPLSVSWEGAYPVACATSPDFAALEAAVATGAARTIGAEALSNLCNRIQLESKAAIGNLFAAVTLSIGLDGTATIGGSIGDGFSAVGVSFDPVQRAIIYTGDIAILRPQPVTGGEAKLSGKLRAEIKVSAQQDSFEASLTTVAVLFLAGVIVLRPVIVGLGVGGSVPAISEGVREVIARLLPAFAP